MKRKLVFVFKFIIRLAMLSLPISSGYCLVHGISIGLESSQGGLEFTVGLLTFLFVGLPGLFVGITGVRFDKADADMRKAGVYFIVAGAAMMLTAVGISVFVSWFMSQLFGPTAFLCTGLFAGGGICFAIGLVMSLTGFR